LNFEGWQTVIICKYALHPVLLQKYLTKFIIMQLYYQNHIGVTSHAHTVV